MPRERKEIPPTLLYTETHEETHSTRSLYYTQKSFIIGEHVATSGSTSKQWSANSGQRYRLTDLLATVESSSIPDIWRKYKGEFLVGSNYTRAHPRIPASSTFLIIPWTRGPRENTSREVHRRLVITLLRLILRHRRWPFSNILTIELLYVLESIPVIKMDVLRNGGWKI